MKGLSKKTISFPKNLKLPPPSLGSNKDFHQKHYIKLSKRCLQRHNFKLVTPLVVINWLNQKLNLISHSPERTRRLFGLKLYCFLKSKQIWKLLTTKSLVNSGSNHEHFQTKPKQDCHVWSYCWLLDNGNHQKYQRKRDIFSKKLDSSLLLMRTNNLVKDIIFLNNFFQHQRLI